MTRGNGQFKIIRMEVIYFDASVEKFVDSLEKEAQTKVVRMIDLLVSFGYLIGMPYSRSLGSSLYELRIRGRQEVRLFYVFHSDKAILVHGFIKKSQQTPTKELNIARMKRKSLTTI